MTTITDAEESRAPLVNKPMKRKPMPQTAEGHGAVRVIEHTLRIGGREVDGLISWSSDELTYSAGSSADITIKATDEDWLAELQRVSKTNPIPAVLDTKMMVNGQHCYFGEEFSGIVDTMQLKPKEGVIAVHVSSYARLLAQKKISESIAAGANAAKITGQVVQELTAKYGKGLKTRIDPYFLTKGMKVGRIFKTQQVKTVQNLPLWDLFQSFAQQDHADLYVKGDTLYYVRKSTEASADITELGPVKPSYTFEYGKNIIDVDVTHNALFSTEVTVTVRSYQPQTQQTYTSTKATSDLVIDALAKKLETSASRDQLDAMNAKSAASMKRKSNAKGGREVKGTAAPSRVGDKENYTFVVPNLSQEDCDRLAARIAEDIAHKAVLVRLRVLCQPDFNPRQYIQLKALPTKIANQAYAIKNIKKSSGPEGYLAEFTLVNHAVQTQGASLGL